MYTIRCKNEHGQGQQFGQEQKLDLLSDQPAQQVGRGPDPEALCRRTLALVGTQFDSVVSRHGQRKPREYTVANFGAMIGHAFEDHIEWDAERRHITLLLTMPS